MNLFHKSYILPLTIFILGFLLRAQETIFNNFIFLIDQGRDMMAVKNIVFDHHLTLIGPYTSLQGVFQGPLYYYLLAIPTFLTSGDPWGGVFLMLLISLATIVISFFWMKKLFGKKSATVTLFLLAISPGAVAAATYIWNPHPMWLIITLYIFVFYEIYTGTKKYHLFLWPTIALMFHFQAALATFIFLGSLLYSLIFERIFFRTKEFYKGLLISLIFFLPQILFELRHSFLMTKSILKIFTGGDQGLFAAEEPNHYLDVIKGHIYNFSVNFNSSFLHDGDLKSLPFFLFVFLVFMILFARKIKVISKKENEFTQFITRLTIILLALMLLYPFPIRFWFLTGFEMFYIIPLGIFLSKLLNFPKARLLLFLFFATSIYSLLPHLYSLYFRPDYGGVAKIKGKLDAIDYIYRNANKKDFNLLIFTPPVYTFAYDYLVWWKAKTTYNYLAGNEKKNTFYLLIEPDSSQPWTYKGWLETVIKTGKIISTKQLPSGLIVQKRTEKE